MKFFWAVMGLAVAGMIISFALWPTPSPAPDSSLASTSPTGPDIENGFFLASIPDAESLAVLQAFEEADVDGGPLSCGRGVCGIYVPLSRRYQARAALQKTAATHGFRVYWADAADFENPGAGNSDVTFDTALIKRMRYPPLYARYTRDPNTIYRDVHRRAQSRSMMLYRAVADFAS